MKAVVTEECIACEICTQICPAVFEMGDQFAEVQTDPVPADEEEHAREAAVECPTSAIQLTE